jgi:hypothetical protein
MKRFTLYALLAVAAVQAQNQSGTSGNQTFIQNRANAGFISVQDKLRQSADVRDFINSSNKIVACDGVTDDATGIQNALTYGPSTITVSDATQTCLVTANNLVIPDGVTLRGDGHIALSGNRQVLLGNGSIIDGIEISCTGRTLDVPAVAGINKTGWKVINSHIHGCSRAGVEADASTGFLIAGNEIDHMSPVVDGDRTALLGSPLDVRPRLVDQNAGTAGIWVNGARSVNTSGTAVTLAKGPSFDPGWAGKTITLTASSYVHIVGLTVTQHAGSTFSTAWAGLPINVQGTMCTVGSVTSPTVLVLAAPCAVPASWVNDWEILITPAYTITAATATTMTLATSAGILNGVAYRVAGYGCSGQVMGNYVHDITAPVGIYAVVFGINAEAPGCDLPIQSNVVRTVKSAEAEALGIEFFDAQSDVPDVHPHVLANTIQDVLAGTCMSGGCTGQTSITFYISVGIARTGVVANNIVVSDQGAAPGGVLTIECANCQGVAMTGNVIQNAVGSSLGQVSIDHSSDNIYAGGAISNVDTVATNDYPAIIVQGGGTHDNSTMLNDAFHGSFRNTISGVKIQGGHVAVGQYSQDTTIDGVSIDQKLYAAGVNGIVWTSGDGLVTGSVCNSVNSADTNPSNACLFSQSFFHTVAFGGGTLNDLSVGVTQASVGAHTFAFKITATTPDRFQWSIDSQAYSAAIACGTAVPITLGLTMTCATTGHAVNDSWTVVTGLFPINNLRVVNNTFGAPLGIAVSGETATESVDISHNTFRAIQEHITFAGSGLNDLAALTDQVALGTHYYNVQAVAGTPDQYRWSQDGGAYSAPVNATGSLQTVIPGLQIQLATTGHSGSETWTVLSNTVGVYEYLPGQGLVNSKLTYNSFSTAATVAANGPFENVLPGFISQFGNDRIAPNYVMGDMITTGNITQDNPAGNVGLTQNIAPLGNGGYIWQENGVPKAQFVLNAGNMFLDYYGTWHIRNGYSGPDVITVNPSNEVHFPQLGAGTAQFDGAGGLSSLPGGITHTTTLPCTGTLVFTKGSLTGTTGTC